MCHLRLTLFISPYALQLSSENVKRDETKQLSKWSTVTELYAFHKFSGCVNEWMKVVVLFYIYTHSAFKVLLYLTYMSWLSHKPQTNIQVIWFVTNKYLRLELITFQMIFVVGSIPVLCLTKLIQKCSLYLTVFNLLLMKKLNMI